MHKRGQCHDELTPGTVQNQGPQPLRGVRFVVVLPNLGGGGAERVSLYFLAAAAAAGAETHLVVFQNTGPLATDIPQDAIVHELGAERLRRALFALVRCLHRLNPRVVYSSHGYVNIALIGISALLRARPRLLLREANTPSQSLAHQRFTTFFHLAYRFLYPAIHTLICQSSRMRNEFVENYGMDSSRVVSLYNPTDETTIRTRCSPRRDYSGVTRVFVCVGSLTQKKGFDRLLQWLIETPMDARILIFGDGPERDNLNSVILANRLSPQVQLMGYSNDPWSWLAGADALLLPSRWEGMPNVVLESLACGVPVIASADACGVDEIAARTVPGAVTVARTGVEFVNAMKQVTPNAGAGETLRASLLPKEFALDVAQRHFVELVTRAAM